MEKVTIKRLASVAGFVIGLLILGELLGLRQSFSLPLLRQTIDENLVVGLLLFVGFFTLGNLIQIPGWIFLAAAVVTLGKFYGGLATYFAAVISCLVTFRLIHFLGGDALREIKSPLAQKLFKRLDKHPLSSIILLRVLFQTVPVLNYTLALSGVKFRHYVLGTVIGLPLPIMLYCLFFEFLARYLPGVNLPA